MAAVAALAYGGSAGRETLEILVPLGAVTVVATHALIQRRERLGGLRRQVLIAGALIIGQLLRRGHPVRLADARLAHGRAVHRAARWRTRRCSASGRPARWRARCCRTWTPCGPGSTAVGEGSREVRIAAGGRDELSQLGRDVEQMVALLREEESMHRAADGARRHLLAAVSHDLRTPLTSIQLLAEAIEDDIVDERTLREYVSRAGHPRARAERPDRRPVRAVSIGGGRHPVDDGAGGASPICSRRRWTPCVRRPTPARWR